jgi:hypothetical protein
MIEFERAERLSLKAHRMRVAFERDFEPWTLRALLGDSIEGVNSLRASLLNSPPIIRGLKGRWRSTPVAAADSPSPIRYTSTDGSTALRVAQHG